MARLLLRRADGGSQHADVGGAGTIFPADDDDRHARAHHADISSVYKGQRWGEVGCVWGDRLVRWTAKGESWGRMALRRVRGGFGWDI